MVLQGKGIEQEQESLHLWPAVHVLLRPTGIVEKWDQRRSNHLYLILQMFLPVFESFCL